MRFKVVLGFEAAVVSLTITPCTDTACSTSDTSADQYCAPASEG